MEFRDYYVSATLLSSLMFADKCSFAMLTGKPPFQSATADEIYRRAREREYDWPKLDTSENFISDEIKDLVSALLQAPEKRPDPDTIVQHPFFTCGWLPQSEEMTPSLREKQPDPSQFLSVGVRAGRSNLYLRNLKKLCIKCEVGPWNLSPKHHTSTYREVEAEEKAGRTPAIPLPEDIVYRPFDEWQKEQAENAKECADEAASAVEALEKILSPVPASRAENLPSSSRPTQSYAAQQRGRPPSTVSSTSRIVKTRQPAKEPARDLLTLPIRYYKLRQAENQVSEEVADVEDRLAADLVNHLNPASAKRDSEETDAPTISLPISASLFNPRERVEVLPNTNQEHILEGLRRLQTELERALNSRSIAIESKSRPPNPSVVIKWVDYTNKYGLGYILNNGSVGCIFRALPVDPLDTSKGYVPPSCLVIRDADKHLHNRTNESYVDRYQIVPISGPNIEFYENRGENGIWRGKVNPQNYKIQVGINGEVGKLDRGVDEWDDRKRELIILWKKFSNYMITYGKDQDYPNDEVLTRAHLERQQGEITASGNVVTFFQRWGDVGCWGFTDGHYQVSVDMLPLTMSMH
jgi:serine/threonine protein kinase